MKCAGYIIACCLVAACLTSPGRADDDKPFIHLDNANHLDMRTTDSGIVWYGDGNIRGRVDSTSLQADSVIWYQDYDIIHFAGRVEAYDSAQHLWAGKVSYYHRDSVIVARRNVVMIHHLDSIRAEAQYAEFDQTDDVVFLENDPWLYLNYPDLDNLVKITANYLTFFKTQKNGMAEEDVHIFHQRTVARCGCADFFFEQNRLALMDDPRAIQDSSRIQGEFMDITFGDGQVQSIDVFDNAEAYFIEESDTSTGEFSGEATLTGKDISFFFRDDEVRKIAAMGAARSDYLPAADDTTGAGKNFVSGDSIFIFVEHKKITKAEVRGGAEGIYVTAAEGGDETADEPDTCQDCYTLITTKEQMEQRAADSLAVSEDAVAGDSLTVSAEESVGDTLAAVADSAIGDSLATEPEAPAEDSIHYQGKFLEFFAAERIIRITGDARVRQLAVELKAHKVDYDIPRRMIIADGLFEETDSIPRLVPLSLRDGGEEILGSKLVFNVDTKKGLIEDAATQYEKTHYRGDDLYKEEENVFYVEDGILIPCDEDDPDFHFFSKRMKVIQDDRVIARPATLYIYKLPVAWIPYYVFPLQRGRHSGILPIKLGNFEKGNRFIGNLGYYWAASEYWDLQASLDFYENIGYTLNSHFRYNKRYDYSGQVLGSYARERQEFASGENRRRRWSIRGSHNQTLPYEIKFGASGTFLSDDQYYTDYSTNPDERLNRQITSKANFNKSLDWGALSLSFSHTDYLDTDSRIDNLPSGRFSIKSFRPFGSGKEVDGKTVKKWYNSVYVNFSDNFSLYSSRQLLSDGSKTRKEYAYIDHNFSVSSTHKLLSYISLNPTVRFQETWYYIMQTDQANKAGIPGDRAYRRGAVSAGISTRTDLYGTFGINQLGLVALRHVMSPSLGFEWAPAITKNSPVKSYAGPGGGGNRRMSLSMGLTHLLQAKIKRGDVEEKLDLLRVSSRTGYNFEATGKKFSTLSTSISSSVLRNVNISGSLTHDLYDENDELKWWAPRLKTFSINSSFQARGSVSDDYSRQGLSSEAETSPLPGSDTLSSFPSQNLPGEQPASSGKGSTSWNMNFSHSYSESRSIYGDISRTHWANVTVNANLTTNWRVKYSQRYDFIRHETIDRVIDLQRRLKCWEGHFYWIPNGSRKGFYFKIFLLTIPDIKVEKSESGLRGALFNR